MSTALRSQADIQEAFAQLMDLQGFEESSMPERFRQFKLINDLLSEVIAARDLMQDSLYDDMEGDVVDLPNIGVFVREKRGRYTRWRADELLTAIRGRIWESFKDWDEAPTTDEAVREATATLAKVAGIDRPSHNWRAQQLKSIGIKPSSFADYEEGTARRIGIVA